MRNSWCAFPNADIDGSDDESNTAKPALTGHMQMLVGNNELFSSDPDMTGDDYAVIDASTASWYETLSEAQGARDVAKKEYATRAAFLPYVDKYAWVTATNGMNVVMQFSEYMRTKWPVVTESDDLNTQLSTVQYPAFLTNCTKLVQKIDAQPDHGYAEDGWAIIDFPHITVYDTQAEAAAAMQAAIEAETSQTASDTTEDAPEVING